MSGAYSTFVNKAPGVLSCCRYTFAPEILAGYRGDNVDWSQNGKAEHGALRMKRLSKKLFVIYIADEKNKICSTTKTQKNNNAFAE